MTMDVANQPWRMTEPWPVTLVASRQGDEHPDLEETLAGMAKDLNETITILEMHGAPDEAHPFSVVISVPGINAPVLLACERAKSVADAPLELQEPLSTCGWVLIGETLFHELLR